MTTEIFDGRYMSGLWFIQGFDMDWLGTLWRDEGEPFVFDYRFRYYRDNLATADSKDEKHFFRVSFLPSDTEEFCVGVIKTMVNQLIRSGFSFDEAMVYMPIKSDDSKEIMSLLSLQPWVHYEGKPKQAAQA